MPENYQERAKECAHRALAEDGVRIAKNHLYVVWFAKTLGNWKALISTDVIQGVYVEVTHNGLRQETYVDVYEKRVNKVYPDGPVHIPLVRGD